MKRCIDCNKLFENVCTTDITELEDPDCLLKFQVVELRRLNESLNQAEVIIDGCKP